MADAAKPKAACFSPLGEAGVFEPLGEADVLQPWGWGRASALAPLADSHGAEANSERDTEGDKPVGDFVLAARRIIGTE